MTDLHFVYYVRYQVLHFRISDGRTGSEPPIFGETSLECLDRLKVQLGLPDSCTFEYIN